MSRGLGKREHEVLASLRVRSPQTTPELAARLYGPQPSRAKVEGLRRAVRTLAAKGRVVVEVQRVNRVALREED